MSKPVRFAVGKRGDLVLPREEDPGTGLWCPGQVCALSSQAGLRSVPFSCSATAGGGRARPPGPEGMAGQGGRPARFTCLSARREPLPRFVNTVENRTQSPRRDPWDAGDPRSPSLLHARVLGNRPTPRAPEGRHRPSRRRGGAGPPRPRLAQGPAAGERQRSAGSRAAGGRLGRPGRGLSAEPRRPAGRRRGSRGWGRALRAGLPPRALLPRCVGAPPRRRARKGAQAGGRLGAQGCRAHVPPRAPGAREFSAR